MFKRLQRQTARNGGESLQKVFQYVTTLQIFEKSLNRHASASEYWHTVHRIWIFCDGSCHDSIVS